MSNYIFNESLHVLTSLPPLLPLLIQGEGDGKNDVTDQIENEEQLLGLKGDEEQEAKSQQEKKELNQDEVDTGMEMEGDFEGETYDMPEQQENENNDEEGDNEEEVDREMGDGNDPNEQVRRRKENFLK